MCSLTHGKQRLEWCMFSGQYVHLPSLVQTGTCCGAILVSWGGYTVFELVSMSLRFGSLLNPTIGFVVKIGPQSGLLEIIFQFLWIIISNYYWCCYWVLFFNIQ